MAHESESPGGAGGSVGGLLTGVLREVGHAIGFLLGGGGEHGKNGGGGRFEHFHSMEHFLEWVADWGLSRLVPLVPMFLFFSGIVLYFVPNFPMLVLSWAAITAPFWLFAIVVRGAWGVWIWYVRSLYIASLKTVLLEVKMPRDIVKSPRAMEVALTHFWITANETTFIDRYWEGKMRPFFSLEIASSGGDVRFYIWTWRSMQSVVEAAMYGQYPGIELHEAEDYAAKFVFDTDKHDMFANDMILSVDSSGILPIRTYVDFELEKDPKEEYKVDPISQIVEVLSNGKGTEQMWIQILFQAMTDGDVKDFVQEATERVEKIRAEASIRPKDLTAPTPEEEPKLGFPQPTWRQTEQIRAIERHMGKRLFQVGIRVLYAASFEDYNSALRNTLRYVFIPYASQWLNLMRPKRWHGPFDYPWQDFQGIRWKMTSRRAIDAYRRRSYFHPPWLSPYMRMSVEALATLWHPPSGTVESPGFQRIPASKSKPPPNLPM